MIPESVAWALLALVLLCLGGVIWLNNRFPPDFPAPDYTPEAPSVPREFKPRKQRALRDWLALRDAHARQIHRHDQEEAEVRHG